MIEYDFWTNASAIHEMHEVVLPAMASELGSSVTSGSHAFQNQARTFSTSVGRESSSEKAPLGQEASTSSESSRWHEIAGTGVRMVKGTQEISGFSVMGILQVFQ